MALTFNQFYSTLDVLPTSDGRTIFVADFSDNRIQRIDAMSWVVTTVAGSGAMLNHDGPALQASIFGPTQMAFVGTNEREIYVTSAYAIRHLTLAIGRFMHPL